jgi:hypothetical protein
LIWFFWLYMRSVAELSTSIAAVIVAFLLTTYVGQEFADVLHGVLAYTPAFILLLALGVFHARHWAAGRFSLLAAAGVFAIALVFRTLDQEVCPALPIGTHFPLAQLDRTGRVPGDALPDPQASLSGWDRR